MKRKMRSAIVFLFIVASALFMMLASCGGKEQQGAVSDRGVETTPDRDNESADLRQTALDFMQARDRQGDPADLFDAFDGDFEISGFASSPEGIQTIKRKNSVSVVSTNNMQYYGVEAAGFLFYASDYNQKSEVIAALPLQADASQKSTIFTAFGLDTGTIYGADDEGDDSVTLTVDHLTVSEDKKSCTFSKEFMDLLAKEVCEAIGYTQAQTDLFIKKYTGSGVYLVSENKATFEIRLQDTQLGNIHQTVSVAVDGEGKVTSTSFMEYSNPSIGIKTPITFELTYRDVVYRENEPVSATIQLKSTTDASYKDGNYQGAPFIAATKTVNATFVLDCSAPDAPKGSATYRITQKDTYQGETSTYTTTLKLSVDLSKSASQFSFTEDMDGTRITTLKANKVRFATPSAFPAVPQRVKDTMVDYIKSIYN